MRGRSTTVDAVLAAARAFRIDVVLQRTAHRVEPELEARVALGRGLHRRTFPVLAIGEAHEHLPRRADESLRPPRESRGRCCDGQSRCRASQSHSAPARHCAATPCRAASGGCRSPNTPGPATSNVTSTPSAAKATSIPAAMRREETISWGGVRSAIVTASAASRLSSGVASPCDSRRLPSRYVWMRPFSSGSRCSKMCAPSSRRNRRNGRHNNAATTHTSSTPIATRPANAIAGANSWRCSVQTVNAVIARMPATATAAARA